MSRMVSYSSNFLASLQNTGLDCQWWHHGIFGFWWKQSNKLLLQLFISFGGCSCNINECSEGLNQSFHQIKDDRGRQICSSGSPTTSFLLCAGYWSGTQVWPQALVSDRQAPPGADRKAVPWTVAQPPQPGGEEVVVDSGGGSDNLRGPQTAGQPLGRDIQAPSWTVKTILCAHCWHPSPGPVWVVKMINAGPQQDRQLHQEPLELHHAEEGGAWGVPARWPQGFHIFSRRREETPPEIMSSSSGRGPELRSQSSAYNRTQSGPLPFSTDHSIMSVLFLNLSVFLMCHPLYFRWGDILMILTVATRWTVFSIIQVSYQWVSEYFLARYWGKTHSITFFIFWTSWLLTPDFKSNTWTSCSFHLTFNNR